jgi:endonuclease III
MTPNEPTATPERMKQITSILKKTYPDAHCALNHTNALELLIATILSAQCTDDRVNLVTADLFRKYRSAEDFVNIPREELEHDLRSINFFRNKAKSIQGACQMILEEFQGRVPETMEELLRLPGVARKTANVVLGNAFNIASGIVVDTHVARLSQRLGLTAHEQPQKIEQDLIALTPRKDWVMLPHWLIFHGRALCKARNPQCAACPLESLCPASTLQA